MGEGIEIRRLARDELGRIAEIDRTEHIDLIYEQHGTELPERRGNWFAPSWTAEGDGEHSVASQRRALEHYVDGGGIALGAHDATAGAQDVTLLRQRPNRQRRPDDQDNQEHGDDDGHELTRIRHRQPAAYAAGRLRTFS